MREGQVYCNQRRLQLLLSGSEGGAAVAAMDAMEFFLAAAVLMHREHLSCAHGAGKACVHACL